MTAKNMKQLEAMLMKQLKKAMGVASKKALTDLYEETGSFYTEGNPKMYERTGALMNTPRTTPLSCGSKSVSFNAYLDENYTYTTGKNPTMHDVLELTNDKKTSSSVGKLRPALGKSGYWEETEEKIKEDFEDTIKSFFG